MIRLTQAISERDSLISWAVTAVKEPVLYVSDGTFGKLHDEDDWRGQSVPVQEPVQIPVIEESSGSSSETGATESSSVEEGTQAPEPDLEVVPDEAQISTEEPVSEVVE